MDKAKDFEKGWEEYKAKSKQEIEEMIGIIQNAVGGCAEHWAKLIAEELHKNRYRKIHDGEVVLRREEYETYTFIKRKWGNQDAIKWSELVDGLYEFAREFSKETARKLLKKIRSYTLDKEVGMKYLLGKLEKEYGVENNSDGGIETNAKNK